MSKVKCSVILLAAGQGKRMNSEVQKQYLLLNKKPVLYYALKAFEDSTVDEIVLVTGTSEIEYCREQIVGYYGFKKVTAVIAGGKERYHSVYRGLQAVKQADYVLVHDGARPLVTPEIIARTIEGARCHGACAAAMPVKDTVKIADEEEFALSTPDRDRVWLMQTPQTFSYQLIVRAYQALMEREAHGCPVAVTDDAMVTEVFCEKKVKLVKGGYENIKITTPSDLLIAQAFLGSCS